MHDKGRASHSTANLTFIFFINHMFYLSPGRDVQGVSLKAVGEVVIGDNHEGMYHKVKKF